MIKYIIKYDDFRDHCNYASFEKINGCNHPLWKACNLMCTYCTPASAKDMIDAGFNEYDSIDKYQSIPGYAVIHEWVRENKSIPENKLILIKNDEC